MWTTIFGWIQAAIAFLKIIKEIIIELRKLLEVLERLSRNIKRTQERILMRADDLKTGNYSTYKVVAAIYDNATNEVVETEILTSDQLDRETRNNLSNNEILIIED